MRALAEYAIVRIKGAVTWQTSFNRYGFLPYLPEEMQSLYSLGLLLTNEHSVAEECLATA